MNLLGDPFSRPPNPNGQIPPAILAQNVRAGIVDADIAAFEAGRAVGCLNALSAPSAAVSGLERNRQPARGGVVDQPLFGGSGTTLIAAEKNGRIARIMELDPRPERCHSQLIAEKIAAANGFMVRVLDFDPLDLSAAEVQRIKEFDGLTVNVVGRGMRFPDLYGAKPWSLGAGAITPSSFLMTNLQMSVYSPELSKQLRKKIKKMDDLRRCVFELDVFRDMNPLAQKMLIPWFKATAPKMVAYMEAQHAQI